jgi:hypothetical protein
VIRLENEASLEDTDPYFELTEEEQMGVWQMNDGSCWIQQGRVQIYITWQILMGLIFKPLHPSNSPHM